MTEDDLRGLAVYCYNVDYNHFCGDLGLLRSDYSVSKFKRMKQDLGGFIGNLDSGNLMFLAQAVNRCKDREGLS